MLSFHNTDKFKPDNSIAEILLLEKRDVFLNHFLQGVQSIENSFEMNLYLYYH